MEQLMISKEQWRKILLYRSPIKTFVSSVSLIGKLMRKRPSIVSTRGGHKHPIIEAIYMRDNKMMFMGKEIIIQ